MSKILKITGNIVAISIDGALLLLLLFAFVIRTSTVQTYLGQRATAFLSKELNTTLKIDKIDLIFFDRATLNGVFILDQKKDTLAYIPKIYVTLDELNLTSNFAKIGETELSGGVIQIRRDALTGDYNYWFLEDYFSSGKRKKKSKPLDIYVKKIHLKGVDFSYDDFRKGYSEYGMDYDHIEVKNIHLEASNFSSKKGILAFHVEQLKAREKCGFVLNKLAMDVKIEPDGLKIERLNIQTPYSDIQIPKFHLLLDEMIDFETVEDSVTFDAAIAQSKVSLIDVAYFASALEGMDQVVHISGKVTEKVKNLHLTNLYLKTGKASIIKGDFILPDYRNPSAAVLKERVDFAHILFADLEKITFPKDAGIRHLALDPNILSFKYINASNLRLTGKLSSFQITSDSLKTALGSLVIHRPLHFTETAFSYTFQPADSATHSVVLKNFNLQRLVNNNDFGLIDGNFYFEGEAFFNGKINLENITGNVKRFDYLNYPYSNIKIIEGHFKDHVVGAKVDIRDDNLHLFYDGKIDFKGTQHIQCAIKLTEAMLNKLNLTHKPESKLSTHFSADITGVNPNNMEGSVQLKELFYAEGKKEIVIPSLTLNVKRNKEEDMFTIHSKVADVALIGKVNFETLITDFTEQFSKVFPSMKNTTTSQKYKKKTQKPSPRSFFSYHIETHATDDVFSIFVPDLKISPESKLQGYYDGRKSNFNLRFTSEKIDYHEVKFRGIFLDQQLTSTNLSATYRVDECSFSDSIVFHQLGFQANGTQRNLHSTLTWDKGNDDESHIEWRTYIPDKQYIKFELLPSFFSINHQRWNIDKESDISIDHDQWYISQMKLHRGKQYLLLDGCISKNDADKLNFRANDIDLGDMSKLLGTTVAMEGTLNGWGYISNPYTNLSYMGDASIQKLYLNQREVGDIYVQSDWNKKRENISLTGDLIYRGVQTFRFVGNYFLDRTENNLDFNLIFDQTDIQFTNAFMDPDVIHNIKGSLNGHLNVEGTPAVPKLSGEVNLIGGNAKVEVLGVNFGLNGKIRADEYGFYIDNMPVTDEEGSSAALIGSIYHTNFQDWNFDLQFDLDRNLSVYQSAYRTFVPNNKTMNKFLVLNTAYKEGEYYYGKGFATGTIGLFGDAENIDITVDVKTEKGTSINIPMYGMTEIEEEESYITFKKKGDEFDYEEPKIDFTGVNLDLNFRVTPEAKMRVIFNETTNDEIIATGSGKISIKLDKLGDLAMEGTYRLKEGSYNFAMGPIRQPFYIEDGGTITWTGNPYNATLNLKTYYEVYANLTEIAPDQFQGSTANSTQKIQCYLDLSESLVKPSINFDIKAPKADESGKALINRITNDKDELNRQFFSLMLWKRFQPLRSSVSAGGSAAMDLVSNQINAMLSQVSKDYKLNVNLDSDQGLGESTYEFGLTKGFLDNRLILNGSFGVENISNTKQSQRALIGDVRLEYLLNENGTVRVNVFNESNDFTVIQEKNLGPFTQGAGIHYQEDFDHFGNFKLAQYFLDIFRRKENKRYPEKRKRRQTTIIP